MGSRAMTETGVDIRSAQQARTRALIVPREHGAWGLLFVPLFTGIAVGTAGARNGWSPLVFTVAALSLFWLRTPVESLLGTAAISAQTPAERRISLLVALGLAAISAACLAALLWNGRNLGLWILGCVAGFAFVAQALLKKLSRKLRMTAQIVGAAGLTCTAPAAYYLATGRLDSTAWLLWAANWFFAGNQVHFVQLRIHAARAATFDEKFARGRAFLFAQSFAILVLAIASYRRFMPPMAILAFLPALWRGFSWFFRGYEPLHVKSLGWSEMRQGIVFGVLLVATLIFSQK
jgi:hypothetical protein